MAQKYIYKVLLPVVWGVLSTSCTNKDLWWGGDIGAARQEVAVRFEWTDAPGTTPQGTMRTNLFSRTSAFASYGVSDFSAADGGSMYLPVGASYSSVAYSYNSDAKVYFRNENDSSGIEAYTATMSRTTYTRLFPEERTAASFDNTTDFYIGWLPRFDVEQRDVAATMLFAQRDVLHTCYFEVRNITGAEFITDTRGALSGMSASYYLMRRELSPTPTTLFFSSQLDAAGGRIYGMFSTFGRLTTQNGFTIEILFPSNTNGILQRTWDVTEQMLQPDVNGDYHIVVDGADIVIPDEDLGSGVGGGGFETDVNEWKEETITLN